MFVLSAVKLFLGYPRGKLNVLIPLLTTWLTCDGIPCPFLQLKSFEEMTDHIKAEVVYVNPDTYARLQN